MRVYEYIPDLKVKLKNDLLTIWLWDHSVIKYECRPFDK